MALPVTRHNDSVVLRATHCACLLAVALASLSCSQRRPPQQGYDHAYQLFLQGDLTQCQKSAADGYLAYRNSSPQWATKFANLEAECLIWAGSYDTALTIYSARNLSSDDPDAKIRALSLQASADTHLRHLSGSHDRLQQAENLCAGTAFVSCGNVKVALGMLSIEEGDLDAAEKHLSDGIAFARSHSDRLTEATAQLDLGLVALRQRRFDESADRIAETFRLSDALGAREIAQTALGNQAWGYYRLGDFSRALELFNEAEKRAAALGDLTDQASWLTGIGKIQFERSQFAAASAAFQHALRLEEQVNSSEDIYMAQVPLAQVALETGDLEAAQEHVARALDIAHAAQNHADELHPILILGQIALRRGNITEASSRFKEVAQDAQSPVFLRWDAQRLMANLAEQQNHVLDADREYRAALATFEIARSDVHQETLQLSFLSNGSRIYEDYIHFLIANGKTDEALRWADQSRARTLAQGLGALSPSGMNGPPPLNARQIAAQASGTLLFYSLGNRQSFLWVITPKQTSLFTLPPAEQIETAIKRYRETLDVGGSTENAALTDRDGIWLYRTLVAPAQSLIPKDTRVFIFADAGLNNLNFETLVVPDAHPHFWIEDVSVICASALRVLGRPDPESHAPAPPNLLLIGDSISPSDKYPRLERAAEQVKTVRRHFPADREQIIEQENATPSAYLTAAPQKYSVIHFVAHGTASRTSPLDSAIILSRPSAGSDLFKLYARDIVRLPVSADLVVISACYSAGETPFAGEGLVGLSWAFLRAGARNVVAALGEVSAASAIPLMDRFYEELDHGVKPDFALRNAKLSLLRDSQFQSPFYWAPFQLYGTGRMRSTPPPTTDHPAVRSGDSVNDRLDHLSH